MNEDIRGQVIFDGTNSKDNGTRQVRLIYAGYILFFIAAGLFSGSTHWFILAGLSVVTILYYQFFHVPKHFEYNSEGITGRANFRKRINLSWTQIQSVKRRRTKYGTHFVIQDKSGKSYNFSLAYISYQQYAHSLKRFVQIASEHGINTEHFYHMIPQTS